MKSKDFLIIQNVVRDAVHGQFSSTSPVSC